MDVSKTSATSLPKVVPPNAPRTKGAQGFATALTDAAAATASRRKTPRIMRPILVPRATPIAAAGTASTGRAARMTAAESQAIYGRGTLADILARIRRT